MAISKQQRALSIAGVLSVVALAASPIFASAATQPANTTINATVNPVITISSAGPIAISLTPTAGGIVSSASDTILVSTNNTLGYKLQLADADATTTLISGANTIAAHAGTFAVPTALAANTWGFAIAGAPFDASYTAESNAVGSVTKWAGVPATGSPVQIKTTAVTAANDSTTVWYGVKVDSTKPNGVYTDTVTYTATTN